MFGKVKFVSDALIWINARKEEILGIKEDFWQENGVYSPLCEFEKSSKYKRSGPFYEP